MTQKKQDMNMEQAAACLGTKLPQLSHFQKPVINWDV